MENTIMRKFFCFLSVLLLLLYGVFSYSTTTWAGEHPGSKKITRVGVIALNDYAEKDMDGDYSGINVEYAYKIAQYANLNIEIVLYQSGKTALDDLDNGRIDLMCNVVKTPAREEKYLFTEQPVGRLAMCAFVRKNDDRFSFGNNKQLAKMTFGSEQASTVGSLFTKYCSVYGITPKLKTFASLAQVKAALDAGEIEAGLYGAPEVEGYRTIQNFAPIPYYFICRNSDSNLKNQVDEAMATILAEDSIYFDRLVQKYTTADFTMAMLTNEEKAYIATHPKLVVAVLNDDAPYHSEGSNNGHKGIIPNFYAKLAKLTGFTVTYKHYQTNAQAMQAVLNGEADVMGLYANGQIAATTSGLRLTRPYDNVDAVLLTKANTGMSEIHRLAIKERSRKMLENSVRNLTQIQLVKHETVKTCFEALKNKEVDGIICGMPSATWLVNQSPLAAYKITTLDATAIDLCAATAYDNPLLCSILSKAISAASISFNEIVTDNTLPEDNWQTSLAKIPAAWILALTTILLCLILGLVYALINLRRRQKEKEAINLAQQETELRKVEVTTMMKAVEEKNSFFSNISHDMRTPLNAILGFTRMAQKNDITNAERQAFLSKVESSGNLLLDLINDTLTISKGNSGKLVLRPEPVKVSELFDAINIAIAHAAADKQINFIADRSKIIDMTILADKLSVKKIFLNLLSNAIKYTPAGGHVWFSIFNETTTNGQLVSVISVKDDGIGISPEFLPHIYEPFAQEGRPGYESLGTGLGLPIVKRFVDLMGGTIEVHSEKNNGTEFIVHLVFPPAPNEIKTAPSTSPTVDLNILQGKRVLLCEDNKLNQEIATILLKEKGMTVQCAGNGQEGLDAFTNNAPGFFALILMDVNMPVLDGLNATRQIRAVKRADAQTIPIIAMTADAFEEDIEKCLKAGMNGHIAKPVSPGALYQTISKALTK